MILRLLSGVAGPYILGGVALAFAILAGYCWTLTVRLDAARNATQTAELATAQCFLDQHKAAADSTAQGAESGAKAVDNFTEKEIESTPVAESVATRLVRQCAGAASGDLPVPAAARQTAPADAGAGNATDSAFAAAAGRDIKACQSAMNQCGEVLAFICENGGCPEGVRQ